MKHFTLHRTICAVSLAITMTCFGKKVNNTGTELHRYFCASYEEFGGNLDKANKWFEKLDTTNVRNTAKGRIAFLFKKKQYQEIANLMPKLGTLPEEDADLGWIIIQTLDAVGKSDEAQKMLITLSNKFKSHQEIAFAAANMYIQKKELHNALHIINALLNNSPRRPNNFIFYFLQAQINIQLDKKPAALESVKMALDLHPQFDKGWLLRAMLEEQLGKLEDAVTGYKNYLELAPANNKMVEQHLVRLAFKQKIMQTGQMTASVDKVCVESVLALMEQKQFEKALAKIDQCLAAQPTDTESLLIKIQILTSLGNKSEILKTITSLIAQNAHEELWYELLHLLTHDTISVDQAIAVLTGIEQKKMNNHFITLYLADLYTRAGQHEKALVYLKKSYEMAADHSIKARVLYQLGSIYFKTNNRTEIATITKQAAELQEPFAPLINLLAHHYATKGKDLAQAQKLADQLLKLEPKNPHFIATQAIIHYKRNEFTQAQTLLEDATKQLPGDLTVARYLGKTYYKQHNIAQARQTLSVALASPTCSGNKQQCEKLYTRLTTQLTN